MTSDCISIILPVYNEEGNIAACLRGLENALGGVEHEILVCYDLDEDTTLPAIARMEDKPAAVKLVRNTLGRGAATAIRTGVQAARGDVLVTTMADLSDPPDVILLMARRIREQGADVVSGSRYMKGGSQRGGPRLKTLLSRAAGLSLHWIAGLGTHDATTNFRAYSRRFIEKAEIRSRHGMELALELTVQAHREGFRVDEVPSSWSDRSAGESRFQLWTWLPRYLRWYLAAMASPLFVWTLLLGASVAGLGFAVRHAPVLPPAEERADLPILAGREPPSWKWLWQPYPEHRTPTARLAWLGLDRISNLDARWGAAVNVLLLAASSGILVLALRKFRGRMSWTDAFVPLLLLHWGHWENLIRPSRIGTALHQLLLSILIAAVLGLDRPPVAARALRFGCCLVAFSLAGSTALPFLILLVPWWIRTALRERPPVSPVLSIGLPGLALVLAGLQALPLPRPTWRAKGALEFLAGSLGGWGTRNWPGTAWLTLFAVTFSIAILVREGRVRLHLRGLLAILIGLLILACFSHPDVTLADPFPFLVYMTAEILRPAFAGHLVRMSLVLGLALLYLPSASGAFDHRIQQTLADESLIREVKAGVPVPILARVFPSPARADVFESDLAMLASERKALFRRTPLPDSAIHWDGRITPLRDGRVAFELPRDASFSPNLAPGIHRIHLDFGRLAVSSEEALFLAVVQSPDGRTQRVWKTTLRDPSFQWGFFDAPIKEGDRLRIDVEAPAGTRYWVLLNDRPADAR
jgi:hypothetical protein